MGSIRFERLLALILAGALGLPFASWANTQIEKFSFKSSEIKAAQIHNAAGNVHIAPITSNETHVVVHKRHWGPRCNLVVTQESSTLKVDLNDKSWILDQECRADLVISLPKEITLSVQSGSGDVRIVEQRGSVDVKVGSGLIDVKGGLKNFRALNGNGPVKLIGSAEKAEIRTGHGDIHLKLDKKDQPGDIAAITGVGDVTVDIPDDAKLSASTVTGNGRVSNRFPKVDEKPEFKVKLKSGTGNIEIH